MHDKQDFRLTPEQREQLPSGVDASALERFLGALPLDVREDVLLMFLAPKGGKPWVSGGMKLSGDPALEQLFQAIWKAPLASRKPMERVYTGVPKALQSPATVALIEHWEDTSGVAVVWRRDAPEPRELILLPEHVASGAALAAALLRLAALRFAAPSPGVEEWVAIHEAESVEPLAEPFRTPVLEGHHALEEWLRTLRETEPQDLAGLGRVRMRTYVPAL